MILRENELKISIHAPTRGATIGRHVPSTSICISIHAPTRGATIQELSQYNADTISIHAPTRGATISNGLCDGFYAIFQSTLPREERQKRLKIACKGFNFNPRSHERSDKRAVMFEKGELISIHAPTRGATLSASVLSYSLIFQSTLPREERRPHHSPLLSSGLYFNPRSHERSDEICHSLAIVHKISIHAPTRGATSHSPVLALCLLLFQSTLPREERQQYCTKNLFIFIQYRQ